jgi:diadenosine tetraphosphate (Ap4A) HIT family hydrolase
VRSASGIRFRCKPYHYLVIPKRRLSTFFELAVPEHRSLLHDVLETAERAIGDRRGRYLLSANYGSRQDVMQVHFHLTDVAVTSTDAPDLSASSALTRNALAAKILEICQQQRAAVQRARGATLQLGLVRTREGIAWSRAPHFTVERGGPSAMRPLSAAAE